MNGGRGGVYPARPYVPEASEPEEQAHGLTCMWDEEMAKAMRARVAKLAAAAEPPRPRRGWAEAAVRAERRVLDAIGRFLVAAGTKVKGIGAGKA